MKMTQALLDHLKACKEGNDVGIALNLVDCDSEVVIPALKSAGYEKYAEWIEKVIRTPEAVRFSGGEFTGMYKFLRNDEYVYFGSYEEAYQDREKLIQPIFLQHQKEWFPVVQEILINEEDVAWKPVDIYQAPEGSVLQVFNMFTGQHHRFENKAEAISYREEIIERRMVGFKPSILREMRTLSGDSAWEVVNLTSAEWLLKLA